jgi:chromosome segregation protein
MLKALELYGFKSFADKTRFEFPEGITVVVGPNGSGKSNVVDAIKWVLGEQSAKSLRGQDMADVIFKGGSTQGGRKPMNVAEATIIFQNADRRLAIDAPEVHITRRVYRSGEGEYLINRQPSRLKDIKDLIRGTGVGGDAYSLIEQGKVDRLLQASAKDRRAMFEEAAGISRFKAKKVDAQRRLERVEQNLLRLSDIVEEVENRLRSVRAQAAKARRYREYGERLQQLRTQVGFADWRKFSEKLTAMEREIARLRDESAAGLTHAEMLETRTLEIDTESASLLEESQAVELRTSRCRQQVALLESSMAQQRQRLQEYAEEHQRLTTQLTELCSRAGNLQDRIQAATRAWQEARGRHQELADRVAEEERQLSTLASEYETLRSAMDSRRSTYVSRMKEAAGLTNEISSFRSQLALQMETQQRARTRLAQLDAEAEACEQLRGEADELCERTRQAITLADQQVEQAQRELAESRRLHQRRQEEIVELLGRLSGTRERAAVLDELEQKHEGIDRGVTELLDAARSHPEEPFAEARGLVADFVEASVDLAPLVDAALGMHAQFVIVDGYRLIDWIATGVYRPSSQIGLVPLQGRPEQAPPGAELELHAGVIGRADRLVETPAEFADVIRRLLGTTWFVEDLPTATQLAERHGSGCRWVTRTGQVLEADGTLIAGPRIAAETGAGIVSRRSQLRDLRNRIEVLEYQVAEGQREGQRLQVNIDQQEQTLRAIQEEQSQRQQMLAEHRAALGSAERRAEELRRSRQSGEQEHLAAQASSVELSGRLERATVALVELENELARQESEIGEGDRRLESIDRDRQERVRLATQAKIEAARSEQGIAILKAEVDQYEMARQERSRGVREVESRLVQCRERTRQAELEILRASSEAAPLYLEQQASAAKIEQLRRRRGEIQQQRTLLVEQLQSQRKELRANEEETHRRELAAGQVRHERAALVDRLRDDYGIDLATLEAPTTGEELQQREQAEEEIQSLRKRIHALGAVNMDALAELDELESRFNSLSGQFNDLREAKESLERIIVKINADSRRIFLETLDAIRHNFHDLYRRAFGGGHADIVLEEGADVLEGGVEIIATPPGKPSFNNSLLSGGEKALTAVALLLAIFKFRPSPFCVLDEVDAPFDEANVGRFIEVLKEFLSFTKFVIVTHSKKTMTAANTLYGVTMQESGVSKRVSVQFEDVSEDGEIRAEAVARENERTAQGDDEAA